MFTLSGYTLGNVTTTTTHRSFYRKGEGETSDENPPAKSSGQNNAQSAKTKTGHSDRISEPLSAETQTTAQIEMWHMWPTRLRMRAGNE